MTRMIVVVALTLAGCAGSQSHLRLLEKDNALSVTPVNAPTHDYVVSVRRVFDFGYDPDDKPTRDRVALQVLSTQCPGARIVGETVINTGEFALGAASRTYAIQVKCS